MKILHTVINTPSTSLIYCIPTVFAIFDIVIVENQVHRYTDINASTTNGAQSTSVTEQSSCVVNSIYDVSFKT